MKAIAKLVTLTLLALLLALLFTACGGSDENGLEVMLERGHIVVGIFGESPPFGYVDAAGNFAGRDAMIARRFAYELFGDEDSVEFIITEAANRIEFLTSNRVDIIIANFTVTPEREEVVDFTLPYGRVTLSVIAPDDAGVSSIADLVGLDLIVTAGTTAEIYFTQNHPDINLLRFPNNVASFQALSDGRGAAMAHDNSLLLRHVHDNEGFVVVEYRVGNEDVLAPAIRQNEPELYARINEITLRLRAENFFYEVFDATMRDFFHPDTNPSDLMYN